MATHPAKAISGAIRGRPRQLPPDFLVEVRMLISAGFTVLEIAEHFGVDRSTMYRQRKFAPEFMQSLKDGRGAFVALEAAMRALEAAEATEQTRRAAGRARALFETIDAPAPSGDVPVAGSQEGSASSVPEGGPAYGYINSPVDPLADEYDGPGAAIPMDDPLGRW